MGIMNVKKAIILLLMIGALMVAAGCARWPYEPGPEPETDYRLEITVEVAGEINSYDGIYYIGLDTDGNSATGPREDISLWEGNFYYVKLDNMGCYLYPKEEGSAILLSYSTSDIGSKLQVTIALSDLGDPESSIDINAVTTKSDGYTIYDYLDNYFPINTVLYSTGEGISSNDLEDDEADFDIVSVKAKIKTPFE